MTRYGTVRYDMIPYRAICLVLLVLHTFQQPLQEEKKDKTSSKCKIFHIAHKYRWVKIRNYKKQE